MDTHTAAQALDVTDRDVAEMEQRLQGELSLTRKYRAAMG